MEAQRSAGARRNGAGQRRGEEPERSKPRSDPARRSAGGCCGGVPREARERSERGESGPRAQRAGLTNPTSYKSRHYGHVGTSSNISSLHLFAVGDCIVPRQLFLPRSTYMRAGRNTAAALYIHLSPIVPPAAGWSISLLAYVSLLHVIFP